MGFEDMPVISRLIVVDPAKAFYIVYDDPVESLGRFLGILDHLLEGTPAERGCAAYGIIGIEFYQAQVVLGGVGLYGLFLVWDGLFLAVRGAADIADRPVILACSGLFSKHVSSVH